LNKKYRMENQCKYISSRGILKSCDVHSLTPVSSTGELLGYDFSQLKPNDVMYVCSTAISRFIRDIFPAIQTPFVLVTGDCDASCPDDLFPSHADFLAFIENPRILAWYSQNCILTTHAKLHQIPIGQDYHTLSNGDCHWGPGSSPIDQERTLDDIRNQAPPFWERKCKAYANFHFSLTTKYAHDRHDALAQVPREMVDYESNRWWRVDTWKHQVEYAFVLSPHGGGLDCHRTWEAICLGCIPIVKTSGLDPLYTDLPVLIVNEWRDVTPELLTRTVEEYKSRTFRMEKLHLSYWMDQMRRIHI